MGVCMDHGRVWWLNGGSGCCLSATGEQVHVGEVARDVGLCWDEWAREEFWWKVL